MMENNQELENKNESLNEEYLLEVNHLKMYFDITTGFFKTTPLKAVDDVSFKIKKGETLGVVGESGCGKTTLGRTIMNLYKASSGEIIYDGQLISSYSDLKKIKKECKFEISAAKFEKNKKIRVYKKTLEERYAHGTISEDDLKGQFLSYTQKTNEEYIKNKEELIKLYDKKYQDKKVEIENAIQQIIDTKNASIAKVEVVNKESDLEAIAKVDKKTLELKNAYAADLAKAKETRALEYAKAKEEYNNDLASYKEFVNSCNEAEANLKASGKEDELKSLIKENTNDKIVKKEKIKGDYNIRKSIAHSNFISTKNNLTSKLKSDISEVRKESKYYSYVDKINELESNAKADIDRIKSSSKYRLKNFRKKCTMVFQDPYSSLNPRMTVQDIIAEPLDVNKLYTTKEERRSMVLELMRKVGLSPEQSTRYAHEFSGGQRQRIGIARALAVNPEFIICDEPVSALDVSIQAQVINTFQDLQKQLGLTYLFIAHDLLVVRHISNRIAVMYLGRIVEIAETNELFNNPMHPYTISLLSAVPMPDPNLARSNKRIILEGDVPSPLNVPTGCPFRTRCSKATEECMHRVPKLKEVVKEHFVSCLQFED